MPSSMFDNYPQPADYIPDNHPHIYHCDDLDEIVVGGTAIHTFKLMFLFSQNCNRFEIFYRQSVTNLITIDSSAYGSPYTKEEIDGITLITVTLDPEDTKLFDFDRYAEAQIKLYMKDGSVVFGDINKIKVISTIEHKEDGTIDVEYEPAGESDINMDIFE